MAGMMKSGALARKARSGLGDAMARMSLQARVEGKDPAPIAPPNVVLFPEADLTTIPGFARKTPEEAAKAKAPAMVKLESMEAEAEAIKARHPNHAFTLEALNERDLSRGSLDRLDASEERRHKKRVNALALRRATLLSLEEDDSNMRSIYDYYGEAEKSQNPQEVKARNKQLALERKQEDNARWAEECAEHDRRKAKRSRVVEEEEPEYDDKHQVRNLNEDDHS